jgi:two-component system sensor histidine kinase PilS (NtrC family)
VRLSVLLLFRVGIATALLALTLWGEWRHLAIAKLSTILYLVVIGNYVAVVAIGLLARWRAARGVLTATYLVLSVASAFWVVQATGVVDSVFTFFYLLAILDAALIGGRPVALVVAGASSVAYGAQLVLQVYDVVPAGRVIVLPDWEFATAGVVNLSGFYLTGLLAGHLADLLRRARQQASQATADLEQAEVLQSVILDALPVGVLAVDEASFVRAANVTAGQILRSTGELVGAPLPLELSAALPAPGAAREVRVGPAGDERVLGLLRSRAAALDSVHPLSIIVIEDRTERAALEQRLAARERLASIGELAAGIAHEIRNPLAAISGSLELLLPQAPDDSSASPLREIVRREIGRLDRLVDDFLQFARPQPIERSRVDLVGVAREVCAVLRADERIDGSLVELVAPERLDADVDPERFRQVLWNLLRNALEASPVGAPVELRLSAGDGELPVRVEVRDHGPGLDPSIRAHLFEPFRTTKPKGTGLGLAVVNRIVESHGGSVELDDAAGGGAIARVRLPA